MKYKLSWLTLALATSTMAFAQTTPNPSEWNYNVPNGPYQWGSKPGYSTCSVGADQSPIDIEDGDNAGLMNVTPDASLEPLDLQWSASKFSEVYNGHTLQMNYDAGSKISLSGSDYDLKQFHFHSPSEHILNGRNYPLEMHFVHQNASGITVVGVFFTQGAANPSLQTIWDNAPKTVSTNTVAGLMINANDFLPKDLKYFAYKGSLTTPPCTEGVNWMVIKEPIEASAEQLRFLQKRLGGPNNRPIQPLDERSISESL